MRDLEENTVDEISQMLGLTRQAAQAAFTGPVLCWGVSRRMKEPMSMFVSGTLMEHLMREARVVATLRRRRL